MGNSQLSQIEQFCSSCNRCDMGTETHFYQQNKSKTEIQPKSNSKLKIQNNNLVISNSKLISNEAKKTASVVNKVSLTTITNYRTANNRLINNPKPSKKKLEDIIKIQTTVRRYITIKKLEKQGLIKKEEYGMNIVLIKGLDIRPIDKDKNYVVNKAHNIFKVVFSNGSHYIGNMFNNELNGLGIYTKVNMDVFKGNILNNKAHGYGILNYNNGVEYEGEWYNDFVNNIGIESLVDGTKYKGSFLNGNKSKVGQLNLSDGSSYYGEWKNSIFDGYGIYKFDDGRVYQGEWLNGKLEGYGEFIWPDGKKYVGYYKDDMKCGFGAYLWVKPYKLFVGFWDNGHQSGVGKIIYPHSDQELDNVKEKWGIFNKSKRERKLENKDEAINNLEPNQLQLIDLFDYFTVVKIKNVEALI